MGYNCTVERYPMSGAARIIYISSCLMLVICSLLMQAVFAVVCQRMKGWKSGFAFYLLQLMALFSFLSYLNLLVSYVHGIILFQSTTLSRIIGANYQGSYLSYVLTNTFLTTHRLFYTLFPIKAEHVFTACVLKICTLFIFIFYGSYMAFTMSPLASIVFCPSHLFFYIEERPFLPLLSMLNKVSNFIIGVVNVSAYCIMFGTLFLKGTVTFRRNHEIRMTLQAALVSLFELFFFLYWEYWPAAIFTEFWKLACDGYSMLIYYDVLILPYIMLNKRVKSELKSIFCKQKSTGTVKILSFNVKGSQMNNS